MMLAFSALMSFRCSKFLSILCFDFSSPRQVTDIADAMILRRLLERMLNFGVVCVMTSKSVYPAICIGLLVIVIHSRHPDDLYKNGIQRSSFIPAIELLKSQFEVTDLNSGTGEDINIASSRYLPSSFC